MIEYLKSFILGIIEGITEWLPISSTGHMILFNEIIDNTGSFLESQLYLYVIQLGAILAVVTLFFNKLNPFSRKKTPEEKNSTWQMWFKVIVACVPAGVIGLLLNDFMEKFENWQVVSAMLIIYGIAFILVEKLQKKTAVETIDQMSYKTALSIGAFQVLSIIPGTSRSGSTILGGMLMGCSRTVAAEFSFFLAIPIMFGVSLLKILTHEGAIEWGLLLVGMLVSYIVSMVAMKFLMNFVKKHSFSGFGWYRIVLGVLVIGYFLLK
ncbi:MAG: undecaprenyl-diphosphate phosphatase [Clostridia bacterium]|nr:undecaprenyl-diphosphate phosphatase [Clostridia bacterium]